jgi:hypothetical protein
MALQLTEKVKGMWAKDFDSFLQEYWMDNFMEGQSKDAAIDAIERWIENLQADDFIELANLYGDLREMKALKNKDVFN